MYSVKYRHALPPGALSALSLFALFAASCAAPPVRPGPGPGPASATARLPTAPPGFEEQPGETAAGSDLDGDGKPDVWRHVGKDAAGAEVLRRKTKDLNGDGRIDTWERYGADGASLVQAVFDLDFDGTPDVSLSYEGDRLVRTDLAPGPDGVPRTSSHYESGQLVRKERDTDGDGKVDTWQHWRGGALDRIGVDRDGDGKVDRWEALGRDGAGASGDQK